MVAEAVNEENEARVVCAKCGGFNLATARRCVHCEAHLQVACVKCGATNLRAARNCAGCGTRLHRSAWSRFRRRAVKRVKTWEIVLMLIASVLFAVLLVKLNNRAKSATPRPAWNEPPAVAPDFR